MGNIPVSRHNPWKLKIGKDLNDLLDYSKSFQVKVYWIDIEENSYKMEMVNKSYTNGILPR